MINYVQESREITQETLDTAKRSGESGIRAEELRAGIEELEADEFGTEIDEFSAEIDKFGAESDEFRAEAEELRAEIGKLGAEADEFGAGLSEEELDFYRRWYLAHVERYREHQEKLSASATNYQMVSESARQQLYETREAALQRVRRWHRYGTADYDKPVADLATPEGRAQEFAEFLIGSSKPIKDILTKLSIDVNEFQDVADWWIREQPLFFDPVLAELSAHYKQSSPHERPDSKADTASKVMRRIEDHIITVLDPLFTEPIKLFHESNTLRLQAIRGSDKGSGYHRKHLQHEICVKWSINLIDKPFSGIYIPFYQLGSEFLRYNSAMGLICRLGPKGLSMGIYLDNSAMEYWYDRDSEHYIRHHNQTLNKKDIELNYHQIAYTRCTPGEWDNYEMIDFWPLDKQYKHSNESKISIYGNQFTLEQLSSIDIFEEFATMATDTQFLLDELVKLGLNHSSIASHMDWNSPEEEYPEVTCKGMGDPPQYYIDDKYRSSYMVSREVSISRDFVEGLITTPREKGVIFYGPAGSRRNLLAMEVARGFAGHYTKRGFAGHNTKNPVLHIRPAELSDGFEITCYRYENVSNNLECELVTGPLQDSTLWKDYFKKNTSNRVIVFKDINYSDQFFSEEQHETTSIIDPSIPGLELPYNTHLIGTMDTGDRDLWVLNPEVRSKFQFVSPSQHIY